MIVLKYTVRKFKAEILVKKKMHETNKGNEEGAMERKLNVRNGYEEK